MTVRQPQLETRAWHPQLSIALPFDSRHKNKVYANNNHRTTLLQLLLLYLLQQPHRNEPAELSQKPDSKDLMTPRTILLQFHHLEPPPPATTKIRRSAPTTPSRRPPPSLPPNDLPLSLETRENVRHLQATSRSPVMMRICEWLLMKQNKPLINCSRRPQR